LAAIVVIPARFGSTRFPAKILAADTGKPLVQHVVEQVRKCTRVRDVLVATDDPRIVEALRPFHTRCVMTSPAHQSGTDRIAEVATGLTSDIIINVQGDEPEIEPETIDQLVYLTEDEGRSPEGYPIWTAATPFRPPLNPSDPNLVKVVFDRDWRAMYFSRSPVPFHRDPTDPPTYYLHVGIYAYRRDMLLRLAGWKPTPCELAEKLEQLRALEHGVSIGVTVIDRASHGIDTREQYAAFVDRYRKSCQ
jgi:3-deoxy-manno-octulosonate cytidylyltransferase (CMP-KDO synthetase)